MKPAPVIQEVVIDAFVREVWKAFLSTIPILLAEISKLDGVKSSAFYSRIIWKKALSKVKVLFHAHQRASFHGLPE